MTLTDFLILFAILAAVAIDGHLTRRKLTAMALDLTALTTAVSANTDATTAAVNAIAAAKAEPDQSALDDLTTTITANNTALNAAAAAPVAG